MKATLSFAGSYPVSGNNTRNHKTLFDTVVEGRDSVAASPMEILLQSVAACSMIDVESILVKKRKTIENLTVHIEAKRADEHPRVFTEIHMEYILHSPDATIHDLERSIELSHTKYCSASAMMSMSGCKLLHTAAIVNNNG